MKEIKEFGFRQTPPATPLRFNAEKCIGCNRCMEACMIDVMTPGERAAIPWCPIPMSAGTAAAA